MNDEIKLPSALEAITENPKAAFAQLEDEPANAYEHFLIFLDLGATERTLKKVAEHGKATVQIRQIEIYSTKFKWYKRANAYDRFRSQIRQQAEEKVLLKKRELWFKRREETRETGYSAAELLDKKARDFLAMPLVERKITERRELPDGKTIIEHITVTPLKGSLGDAVRMLQTANTLRRLACEMETERIVLDTPEQIRLRKLDRARRAFHVSSERFPNEPAEQRAAAVAAAFGFDVSEILEAVIQDRTGEDFAAS